jgi:hypothetical protein
MCWATMARQSSEVEAELRDSLSVAPPHWKMWDHVISGRKNNAANGMILNRTSQIWSKACGCLIITNRCRPDNDGCMTLPIANAKIIRRCQVVDAFHCKVVAPTPSAKLVR